MSRRYGWCLLLGVLLALPHRVVGQPDPPLPAGALVRLAHSPTGGGSAPGVAFSPDGKSMVVSAVGTLSVIDLLSGKTIRELGESSPRAVLCSADGRRVAAMSGGVRFWDPASGKQTHAVGGAGGANTFAISGDGKLLATGSDDHLVRLFDVDTGELRREIKGHRAYVTAVALSPDGKTVASGSIDQTFRLWDAATAQEIRRFAGQRDTASAIVFTPDGKRVLSGSWDGSVRLCDVTTGEEVRRFEGHSLQVLAVAVSGDGQTIASGGHDGACRVWEAATGKVLRKIDVHASGVWHVAITPDGNQVATSDGTGDTRVWHVPSGIQRHIFRGAPGPLSSEALWSVALSPDGKLAATGSGDHTVRLWDAITGKHLRLLGTHSDAVWCVAFSPDGKRVASCGRRDAVVRLWDVATGKPAGSFAGGHLGGISRIAFARDGKTLVSGGGSFDPTIFVWDTARGKERQRFTGHTDYVDSVALSPDGKLLASGSRDGTLRIWDTATGKELHHLASATSSVAFSPDGRFLASGGSDGIVRLWNPQTAKHLGQIEGMRRAQYAVAFSPDSRTLLSASQEDGAVSLWEVATRAERRQFRGQTQTVYSLTFSVDGRRAASASADGTAFIWDVTGLAANAANPPERDEVTSLWQALAGADGMKAHAAIWRLTTAPTSAVAQIGKQVQPVTETDTKKIVSLVADLDSDSFDVRQAATQDLERLGESAAGVLRQKLRDNPPLEVRRRIEALLERVDGPAISGESLRAVRAVEVLELIRTPDSRAVLESLAKGAEGARLTTEARAALARLAERRD